MISQALPFTTRLWWIYAAVMLAIGLLLSMAELQHYLGRGGRHPWEPFLWELSSVFCVAWLALGVYRWHVAGLQRYSGPWQFARHVFGALVFTLLHVGGMFAIRFAVYAMTPVRYEPGGALEVLAREAGKDLVTYVFMVAIGHGLHLYFESQRRQHDMERLRGELAEARLTRLAEQVQPHFLFNTLNLISSVMYEDVARADRILCQLADLLRQALAAQRSGWHSLEQELQLVAPFLGIMQARFGERLAVRIEASDEARRCQVPALLLISPVENAIKHDVATSSAEVEVAVRAWLEGEVLQVVVENSGAAPQRTERDGAIGLSNLRERLLASYGDAAQARLGPRDGGGSVLALSLPMRAAASLAANEMAA